MCHYYPPGQDCVEDGHDLAVALRHCVNVCTKLANQSHLIKNTFAIRASLIQHLFLEVVPLPMPCDSQGADSDWWGCQAFRHETQAYLLRLLAAVAQHYAAVSLSLSVTRSFDATRLCTLGAIAAVSDRVLRVIASDVPSELSLHYAGQAAGPVKPFCFECAHFVAESQASRFHDPTVAVARTRILDYLLSRRRAAEDDHVIFNFERSMAVENEAKLLHQVCVSMGYDSQPGRLGAYLSGEDPVIVDQFPELGHFRDVVFLFKAMMCPTSSLLPERKLWGVPKARLFWRCKGGGTL